MILHSNSNVNPAPAICRGVARLFAGMGYAALLECPLGAGGKRRADVVGLNRVGGILIAEVKSCRADFRADRKWQDYLDHCDRFYFAVAADFPIEILPEECGLIRADGFGGAVIRESASRRLNGNRRRALIHRIALIASRRLAAAGGLLPSEGSYEEALGEIDRLPLAAPE